MAGLAAIRFAPTPDSRRRFIVLLTAYVIVTHLIIGVTQKDAWPITNYCLMHGRADLRHAELYRYGFFGVDKDGREWRIDPYAWHSMSDWHLQLWFYIHFAKLSPPDQQQALGWLYGLAEEQRAQLARGDPSISWLGPVSAPQWWMFPRELAVPPEPYRALRVYKDTWFPATIIFDRKPVTRKPVGEWRAR